MALQKCAPVAAISALRLALEAELATPNAAGMVRAYGGSHRCLERFLVARALDVASAAASFRETLAFRTKHGLDDGTFALDETLRTRIQPFWPGAYAPCRTVDGSPLQLFRPGKVDSSGMVAAFTEEEFESYYVAWMERSLVLQNESNASSIDVPDSSWAGMVEVYDMTGLSLSQLYPPGLAMLSRVLSIGQAHYPENLRKLFIINAPYIFSGAFRIIKAGLSAQTVAKMSVDSYDGGEELLDILGGPERLAELLASVPA